MDTDHFSSIHHILFQTMAVFCGCIVAATTSSSPQAMAPSSCQSLALPPPVPSSNISSLAVLSPLLSNSYMFSVHFLAHHCCSKMNITIPHTCSDFIFMEHFCPNSSLLLFPFTLLLLLPHPSLMFPSLPLHVLYLTVVANCISLPR